jgi:hypothetical protein
MLSRLSAYIGAAMVTRETESRSIIIQIFGN